MLLHVIGLKLLTDDLKSSNNPQDTNRNEILSDVNVACRTTVDILNDLLCFDKLESGILEVHKLEVPVLSFLADCVGMFSINDFSKFRYFVKSGAARPKNCS